MDTNDTPKGDRDNGEQDVELDLAIQNCSSRFRNAFTDFLKTDSVNDGMVVPISSLAPPGIVNSSPDEFSSFANFGGHLFVLKILHACSDNSLLQKRSLVLLNVVVAYLRHLLYLDDQEVVSDKYGLSGAANHMVEIIDGGAVSICMDVAIHSNIEAVQILAFIVLAKLLLISEKACQQMFDDPFHQKIGGDGGGIAKKSNAQLLQRNFSSGHEKHSSRLSCLLSVMAFHPDNWKLQGFSADVISALIVDGKIDMANSISQASSCVLPPLVLPNATSKGGTKGMLASACKSLYTLFFDPK